jgi:hypothetical protein
MWLALFGALAWGTPSRVSPISAGFEHSEHERAFAKQPQACEGCHQGAEGGPVLPSLGEACHSCHRTDGAGSWGPKKRWQRVGRCALCHTEVAPPVDHGAGWLEVHGNQARLDVSTCDSCHSGGWCVGCHERREPVRYRVHDRSWLSIHGIAVRTNPAQCSSCHLQADCVACHATADGRLP